MDESTKKVMFSSKSDTWNTPRVFYNNLNKIFSFTLDPCATKTSAKCDKYYTKEDNGLTKDWSGETVFVNPPYTRGAIKKWVEKCYLESRKENTRVVCLIPSRTDTKYWHRYCMKAEEIYLVQGRLKFENELNTTNSAPFPSAVVVFGATDTRPKIKAITQSGILLD